MARKPEKCKIVSCTRTVRARGYCNAHYQRYQDGKSDQALNFPIQNRNYEVEGCKVENCHNKHRSKGYCNIHYLRFKDGKDLNSPIQSYGTKGCKIENCHNRHRTGGYCHNHASITSRLVLKEEIMEQFGDKCHDCGGNFPPCVFDFDNVSTAPGHIQISQLIRAGNRERLQKELKRCEMVCANCHRVRTQDRYRR